METYICYRMFKISTTITDQVTNEGTGAVLCWQRKVSECDDLQIICQLENLIKIVKSQWLQKYLMQLESSTKFTFHPLFSLCEFGRSDGLFPCAG